MTKKLLSQEMLASLVNEIIGEYDIKLTVRQIYYRLVARNVMPNTRSYYNSFDSILTTLRKKRLVDPAAIEDRSRQTIGGDVQKTRTPQEFFKATLKYLKDSWKDYDLPLWVAKNLISRSGWRRTLCRLWCPRYPTDTESFCSRTGVTPHTL